MASLRGASTTNGSSVPYLSSKGTNNLIKSATIRPNRYCPPVFRCVRSAWRRLRSWEGVWPMDSR